MIDSVCWGHLVVVGGKENAPFTEISLSSDSHSLGRLKDPKSSDGNTKSVINKPYISGLHFTVEKFVTSDDSLRYYLKDHSTNGTYVNDQLVKKGAITEIFFGDTISIRFREVDQLVLRFVSHDSPEVSDASIHAGSRQDTNSFHQSADGNSEAMTFKPQINALKEENKLLLFQINELKLRELQRQEEFAELQKELRGLSAANGELRTTISDLELTKSEFEVKASAAEARNVNLGEKILTI